MTAMVPVKLIHIKFDKHFLCITGCRAVVIATGLMDEVSMYRWPVGGIDIACYEPTEVLTIGASNTSEFLELILKLTLLHSLHAFTIEIFQQEHLGFITGLIPRRSRYHLLLYCQHVVSPPLCLLLTTPLITSNHPFSACNHIAH